ncbi:MAG: outer membrane protein assembly factor BamA [Desulfatitalea sp.]|nr:outer membrane protein assembly factor BamA [Desulfatitalea sp.]
MRLIRHALLTLVAAAACLGATAAGAAETPTRVLVIPFEVNAQGDLSYLRDQIPELLAQRLRSEGAQAVTVPLGESEAVMQTAAAGGPDTIRTLGMQYKAQRVIWGSFTLIDRHFSLDTRMLTVDPGVDPTRFFAQGRDLENLITVTGELADQISLVLFQRERVAEITVKGNQRIEADAILRVIETQPGSVYKAESLTRDLRTIYGMGFFDDIRVEAQPTPDGRAIVFDVKEKPTIRRINIRGNSYIKEDDIRDNLTISTGAILNIFRIYSNIDQIETVYKNKNYHQVKVDYDIRDLDNNQADLEFIIDEGPKIYVTEIIFEGNHAFNDRALKKAIKVSEKGFFYWLTSSGDLDRAQLDQDVARINAFYSNQGYVNVRVGEPQVEIQPDGIRITFQIDEGDQFKVGRVDLAGELILPADELLAMLRSPGETYFNRDLVRNDVLLLTDIYADEGYAYADIVPRLQQDPEQRVVDITFDVRKRDQIYLERIIIQGNTRTRDKVIRRELHVAEQGLFRGSGLKRSIRNLYRLDYFEDIKVDTLRGSADDKMNLVLDVTEKPTGTFSFGAGYSSEESVFFTGSIAQRNLFGRGQTLDFGGQIGARTTLFSFNFTEPYLFDSQFSASINAYNQLRDYDDYERKSNGGGLQFGYPVADYTRFFWGYSIDESTIDIQPGYETTVADSIKELEGTNITSSVNLRLVYDSRDHTFTPTDGSRHSIYWEYAGVGGDIGFSKYILQTTWYHRLYRSLIGSVNARLGIMHKNDDNKLIPDYEKFYLGGINSMRGFGWRGVFLTEVNQDGNLVKVGGEKMVQLNVELLFPILKDAGVFGVFFYDTGNIYKGNIDLGNLRQSAGGGIRWLSPIAPIRVEYGYILDRKEGESTGQVEFTLGGSF